jgi:insulysin
MSRLWYKEDTKFLLPKAVLKFELRNPLVYLDPVNVNMANLYVELLKDSLTEYSYMAELAGLKYSLNATNYGLSVSVSGFSDKMDVLLETVVERMASLRIDPQRFAILKVIFVKFESIFKTRLQLKFQKLKKRKAIREP